MNAVTWVEGMRADVLRLLGRHLRALAARHPLTAADIELYDETKQLIDRIEGR